MPHDSTTSYVPESQLRNHNPQSPIIVDYLVLLSVLLCNETHYLISQAPDSYLGFAVKNR